MLLGYLPPANEVCEGYVFTGVCLFTGGGACVVALGRRGAWHAWLLPGGMHGCSPGEPAWNTMRYGDTINERAVRILLECILVFIITSNKRLMLTSPTVCVSGKIMYIDHKINIRLCKNNTTSRDLPSMQQNWVRLLYGVNLLHDPH